MSRKNGKQKWVYSDADKTFKANGKGCFEHLVDSDVPKVMACVPGKASQMWVWEGVRNEAFAA